MPEKILVTGAAGLIGSNFIHWLVENTTHEIIAIDDLSGGYISNLPKHDNLRFFQEDVTDSRAMNIIFESYKPKYVYHMAAYAAENISPFIRNYNYTTNLLSTINIINACIKNEVKRLVFTSSIAVYGHGNPPYNEEQTPVPKHGLDWCIVRPFNIYGERQNIWDKYRNVAGIFMYNHLNGMPMTIFGDGRQVRNFTYVGDLMWPLYNACYRPGCSKQIINIGSDQSHTVNHLADTLIEIMGGGEKEYLPGRHEVKQAFCDISKAKGLLNYKQLTSLSSGMTRMWMWAKLQPKRERKEWKQFELETGLYPIYKSA
jgi:UDP-glucose 4-epimerase